MSPAPMYSLPTRDTFAAFTIASAASTEPINPFVSTSPSASCAIRIPSGGQNFNIASISIAPSEQIRYIAESQLGGGRKGKLEGSTLLQFCVSATPQF